MKRNYRRAVVYLAVLAMWVFWLVQSIHQHNWFLLGVFTLLTAVEVWSIYMVWPEDTKKSKELA